MNLKPFARWLLPCVVLSMPSCAPAARGDGPKEAAPKAGRPVARPSASEGDPRPDLGLNADLHGVQVFPDDNPWNLSIDHLPVDANSAALIASIGIEGHLHPNFGRSADGQANGIPYIVVPGDQPRLPVTFEYADDSDHDSYPIPPDPPIEGGPQAKGDRHIIMLDRDHERLYELYSVDKRGTLWHAGSGAVFDLRSNALRPLGWTSADAAGLPVFPGLVRYDEVVDQGEIRHALRFTAKTTRRAYVHPARHWASRLKDANLPPMGLRVRLKASFDISPFPQCARVILTALKKYGMLLADNGSDWFITGSPHPDWNDAELATIKRVKGSDFEVVQMGNIVHD
ncbi:MAG TPA: hypothetical protein VGX78_09330 [Pirellulales bacterium]|nr:hypothetical protein [Pirellulales bacterium]